MTFLRRWKFHLWYTQHQPPPWDTGISPPELIEFIKDHGAGRALDLGCGTGTNAITLAKHGWQVTGIDFAWSAIRIARQKAKQARLKVALKVDDVTRLRGIRGPFDLILDIGCFHNLPIELRPIYVSNLGRLLALDGTYLLYAHIQPNPANTSHGITQNDLEQFASDQMLLISRQNGVDHGSQPSAWLTFCRSLPVNR